jgi:hypothetical protein
MAARDGRAGDGLAEDSVLARELRLKVQELYGSSDNVAIVSKPDSVEFRVLRRAVEEDGELRSAWFTVLSIGVVTVLSIAGFAALVNLGAVHDARTTDRTYEMPAYGKRSYVNPYELLQEGPGGELHN